MKKIPVGIIGSTGLLGQTYLTLLADHPWFEVTFLAASERSAGKRYGDIVDWQFPTPCPFSDFPIFRFDAIDEAVKRCSLLFSALPNEQAKMIEEKFAERGLAVISNASYSRFLDDVPLLIPEVNSSHLHLIDVQRKKRGWTKGLLVAKPNCAVQAFLLPLAPLDKAFGLEKLQLVTMQAISGAGLNGLASHEIHNNVLPHIEGEEEKLEREPKKILGKLSEDKIDHKDLLISAQCHRIPVLHGHFISIAASFEKKPTPATVLDAWKNFLPEETASLPSAPRPPLYYFDDKKRPQHRLDLTHGGGMGVAVGKLSASPLFDIRFSALSHNAIRGGAGGGILSAELLYSKGYLSW